MVRRRRPPEAQVVVLLVVGRRGHPEVASTAPVLVLMVVRLLHLVLLLLLLRRRRSLADRGVGQRPDLWLGGRDGDAGLVVLVGGGLVVLGTGHVRGEAAPEAAVEAGGAAVDSPGSNLVRVVVDPSSEVVV